MRPYRNLMGQIKMVKEPQNKNHEHYSKLNSFPLEEGSFLEMVEEENSLEEGKAEKLSSSDLDSSAIKRPERVLKKAPPPLSMKNAPEVLDLKKKEGARLEQLKKIKESSEEEAFLDLSLPATSKQHQRKIEKPTYCRVFFNQEVNKKKVFREELPTVVKSNFIPESQKVFNADVVRKENLPPRPQTKSNIHYEESFKADFEKNESLTAQKTALAVGLQSQTKDVRHQEKMRKFFEQNEKQKEVDQKRKKVFLQEKEILQEQRKTQKKNWELARKREKDLEKKQKAILERKREKERRREIRKAKKKNGVSIFSNYKKLFSENQPKGLFGHPLLKFATVSVSILVLFFVFSLGSYGFQIKDSFYSKSDDISSQVEQIESALKAEDYDLLAENFDQLAAKMAGMQSQLDKLGGDSLNIFSALPFFSKISSGKNLVDAGSDLAIASKELSSVLVSVKKVKNPFSQEENSSQSLTNLFLTNEEHLQIARASISSAQKNLNKVKVSDLPEEHREKVRMMKIALPLLSSTLEKIDQNSQVFLEILGHNGPRKYLLIFQNNHEMRATGGFIGSYGLIHIADGRVKNLHIDGIFNPDGQLKEKVVPPKPIQKISAAWSTHDANWFPHFPTSAEKIAWFYEKTGGPTVDGIITLTPTVLKKMLEITGPIEMEEYDKTISSENYVEEIQKEVELDYQGRFTQEDIDEYKSKNPDSQDYDGEPKELLGDLAPMILNKLFEAKDPVQAAKVLRVLGDTLKEKHVLLYSNNEELQKVISERGWAGEIMGSKKDFLMVINSNINGFKTDGVIDEEIEHNINIGADGVVIDTAKIRRRHNGGETGYKWWDKVNANYMRIYVPEGSQLLSIKGITREFTEAPLDYEALNFLEDPDVKAQESSMIIENDSGTRIYNEEGKTVFAGWTYLSPKETIEIELQYQLPFSIDWEKQADSYSIVYQKQSGSPGPEIKTTLSFPENTELYWKYPEELKNNNGLLELQQTLYKDSFLATVFRKKD